MLVLVGLQFTLFMLMSVRPLASTLRMLMLMRLLSTWMSVLMLMLEGMLVDVRMHMSIIYVA